MRKICPKLTIKAPERRPRIRTDQRSGVTIVDHEQVNFTWETLLRKMPEKSM